MFISGALAMSFVHFQYGLLHNYSNQFITEASKYNKI